MLRTGRLGRVDDDGLRVRANHPEEGEVGRATLKANSSRVSANSLNEHERKNARDVGVPSRRGENAALVRERDLASSLLGNARNLADRESILAELLGRVNVEGRVGRLAGESPQSETQRCQILSCEIILCLEEGNTVQ